MSDLSDLRGLSAMLEQPVPAVFTRWQATRGSFTPWAPTTGATEEADDPVAALFDAEVIRAEAYAAGLEEGRKAAERDFAAQRVENDRLIAALAKLQPEPPHDLSKMIAMTVERLVRQVVGEVAIDSELLLRRIAPLAEIMVEQGGPARLRVNPEDAALLEGHALDVTLTPDAGLARGSVVLETAEGWIEDGTDVALDRLRLALDRMAAR